MQPGSTSEMPPPADPKNLSRFLNLAFWKSFLTKAHANRGLERYRRAGISASTSFLSKALTITIGFVSVPLTVHYLGPERYGVWLTISSLLTWMALTDFGLAGNALVNVISDADGRDDRRTALEYTASTFWTLISISTVIGVTMAFSFRFIPWRSLFRVSAEMTTEELHLACALTLVVFVLSLPLNIVNSIYSAYQDGFMASLWGMASNLLALTGLVAVTQFKGGLPALIVATSGTRLLVTMVNAVYLFSGRYRWLLPSPSAVRIDKIRRLLTLGSKYLVTQLSSLGIYQSQPFIITQMLGPSKVPIFVIAYKIITMPVDLSYIALTPFLSAVSEARAREDWKWIHGAFRNMTLACLAVGIPVTIAIACAGKVLVRWLGGPQVVPDWGVIAWLAVYTLIGVGMMAVGQVLCGLDRVGSLAASLVCTAVGTIGLGILFAHPWGLAGVAAGMALAKLTTMLPMQWLQLRRILRITDIQVKRLESETIVA